MDVVALSRESSMAVQDTSVPFRSFTGPEVVSTDVNGMDPLRVILNNFVFTTRSDTCMSDVTSLVLLILSPDTRTSVTFHSIKV